MSEKCRPYKVSDLIIDLFNKDIGLLIRRYNLFEEGHYKREDDVITMVWDIYWIGPSIESDDENLQTYTEEGIDLLFESGVFALY